MKKGQKGAPACFSAAYSTARFLDGWKITFLSVFICVHLRLKFFFAEFLRLSGAGRSEGNGLRWPTERLTRSVRRVAGRYGPVARAHPFL